MKKLAFILLIPLWCWSQEIKDIPYENREWYQFKQDDLSLKPIDTPEEWVIGSTNYLINIHESATYLLYESIDSIIDYPVKVRYHEWEVPFKYSMYNFHDTIPVILVSQYWDVGEEKCGCINELVDLLFNPMFVIYDNISLGDLLKSDRLKEYQIVFYNTINEQPYSTIYQHELVVYYKLKWNPLLKSHRKTHKGTYMIPFKEVVLDNTQMD